MHHTTPALRLLLRLFVGPLLAGVVFVLASPAISADWFPLDVDVWDPPFNDEFKRSSKEYKPLAKAGKRWKLCVSIPHLKDPYWSTVNFALIDEAKRLGVGLRLLEAGGYANLGNQRKQIIKCMSSGADALIVSSISADGISDLVENYTGAGKIVIDMINGMSSTKMTARSAVNFYDTGFAAGTYIRELLGNQGKPVNVGWFPGPDGASWVAQGDQGFRAAIKGSPVRVATLAKGDTGKSTQGDLVRKALDTYSDLDVIVGTTVTAEAAVEILRRRKLDKKIKVFAYYYSPGVHRGIRRGSIVAAPTDQQGIQARMSVDLAVRALEGKPFFRHVAPKAMIVDRKNVRKLDISTSLPPRGFRPIFSVNNW